MGEHIIRIIDGLRYDTATATQVCSYQSSQYSSDFRYEETALFRTSQGRFFLAGFGGPRSRWARSYGNETTGGSGLMPVDTGDARAFAEEHASPSQTASFFEVQDA